MEFTGERVVPGKMENYIGTYVEHLTRYVFCLGFCINKKVMDVACGTGYGLEMISSVAQCGLGVDIDQKSLDFAQKNYKFYGKNFGLIKRDLEKDPLNSGFFAKTIDTVTSFETIEHLENPDFFIQNVKEILKDDGTFIFSIPINNPSKYHKIAYTKQEAKALMEKYFTKIQWFSQVGAHIIIDNENSTFLIGVATNN